MSWLVDRGLNTPKLSEDLISPGLENLWVWLISKPLFSMFLGVCFSALCVLDCVVVKIYTPSTFLKIAKFTNNHECQSYFKAKILIQLVTWKITILVVSRKSVERHHIFCFLRSF